MYRPFFLILALSIAACTGESPKPREPEPQPQSEKSMTSVPTFSGQRAFEYLLKQVSFGPRNPNSVGHRQCLDYLASTLRQFADEVQLQPFQAQGYNEVLALTNVIARFNPEAKKRILLCAHWDTRPRAEQDTNKARRNEPILGANDGASGVAVLLEIASLLKQNPPAIGIDIVLFDGEDYGREGDLQKYFLGSRYFVKNKPPDYLPVFGILLDMVGDKFLDLPKEQHSMRFAPDIVDMVWRKAWELGYTQFLDEIRHEVNDDHLILNQGGIKTINIIDFDYPDPTHRYWHSHEDTPDKCSPESLEAVGTVVTHIVYTRKP